MYVTSQFILFISESCYQRIVTLKVARGITFSEMIKDIITWGEKNYSEYRIIWLSHLETWKNSTRLQGMFEFWRALTSHLMAR